MKAIMFVMGCLVPISIMGMAAFLIYQQVDGWGWFLLCAMGIAGGFSASLK